MMGMFGGGQPGAPKGDINQLWELLGVEVRGDEVIYQEFNPYPRAGTGPDAITPLWVWLMFDETPGTATLAGGALVLAAVTGHILVNARQRN